MDHGSKVQKIPKSAISLYVQLYCKKKCNADTKYYNNLVEATKSWLSLSKDEKHKFNEKLEECRIMYRSRFADYMKNVEPYLKKKCCKNLESTQQELMVQEIPVSADIEDNIQRNNDDYWIDNLMDTVDPHENDHTENYITETLTEPFPPMAMRAVDLHKIVTAIDPNIEQNWNSLPQAEKGRYRIAVSRLKKDYIASYSAYLESLPSQQLFEYYHKTINS